MQLIKKNKKGFFFLLILLVGILVRLAPRPEDVTEQAWNLLAIFIATILGVILKPLPMGATALLALTVSIVTNTLTFEQAFSGFSNPIVWLIVFAFFIARGFINTGLGARVAYFFVSFLGRSTLGLGYGLVAADFVLAPTIPSVTARTGGIIVPILKSLAKAFGSEPNDPSSKKAGAFLTQTAFQGSAITSAMFLTSMAGNPLVAQLAKDVGVRLSWGIWALAAIVPGILSLLIVPYLIYKIYPPSIKETPHAKEISIQKLKEMGKIKSQEWVMLATFLLLIILWIFGPYLNIIATVTALVGLSVLLLTGVLNWEDIMEETGAWNTLFWFAALVTMATFLNKFGLMDWFSQYAVGKVEGFNWILGFSILSLLYFYTHYFFASNMAHIGAMYAPFLIVSIALGTPPMLAALVLGFFSSLFGGISHYGCGPAPILYGAGYVSIGAWWGVGFVVSVANIAIWLVSGGIWWKLLGLW
jgi:divalent anion:Na+ symporter, DASS family